MDIHVIKEAIPEILTQLFGFIIVFYILKKYAFQSIFELLDQRQKRIQDDLDKAERERKESEKIRKDYEAHIHNLEAEARKHIQEAVKEGERIADEIKHKATIEAEDQFENAQQKIAIELEKAQAVIKKQIVELSSQMAGKLIEKNLSTKENEAFVKRALEKVEGLK